MCATIVLREGRPVLALGARGGRQIPNAVFAVLAEFVALGRNMTDAVSAPRLHTEGNIDLTIKKSGAADEVEALTAIGYKIKTAPGATVSAVSWDPQTNTS